MTEAAVKPLGKRRLFFLLAAWALAGGVLILALGWWWWKPLLSLGWLLLILGGVWLACLPLIGNEPISRAGRRYLRAVLPAMGGYVLAIFVLEFLKRLTLPTWAMTLIALLPVLPMIWVVAAVWRLTRESDELERRIQLESVFATCGVVGLLAFAAGMLQMAGVIRFEDGLFYVLPAMFLIYGVAGWWCRRRYGLKGLC